MRTDNGLVNAARIAATVLCVGLACVFAAALLVAAWMDFAVFDTGRYVEAVAPLWTEPAIQKKAAREIDQYLARRIDVAATVERANPDTPPGNREAMVERMRALPHRPLSRQGNGAEYPGVSLCQ